MWIIRCFYTAAGTSAAKLMKEFPERHRHMQAEFLEYHACRMMHECNVNVHTGALHGTPSNDQMWWSNAAWMVHLYVQHSNRITYSELYISSITAIVSHMLCNVVIDAAIVFTPTNVVSVN